jgi:BirA family biotin operon repressor/biotin-[acetyl-CoA-carboxylase] ligase
MHSFNKWNYIHLSEVDSTQDEAMRRIAAGQMEHGTIISADSQTKARGRQNRKWISEAGSLSMTICLEIRTMDQKRVPELSYLTAVVIGDVLSQLSPRLNFSYKWVNDIYINKKKLAGIILEMQGNWLLIGIGMNVHPVVNKDEAKKSVSLVEHDIIIDNEGLCQEIGNAFIVRYENWLEYGFYSVREEWLRHAIALKQKITVRSNTGEVQGIFLGIDDRGRLELMQNGTVKLISAGDMYPL